MKKILAIAVATAIAAPAMADMTIGGTVAAGYESSNTAAGFGIDTAALSISGSETLENGITVSGSMAVGGLQRAGSIGGEDAALTVAGDFGTVAMKSVESGNGVFSWGSAGSPAEEFSGELAAKSNLDALSYTLPKMGNFTVAAGISTGADGVGAGDNVASMGSPDVNVAYAEGALSAFANYKTCATDDTCDDRVRVGVKYDAGVAVVAVAYGNNNNKSNATSSKDYAAGVSVPMGATTLGLNWAANDVSGEAYKDDGVSFGIKHALSSNVSVSAKYTEYSEDNVDKTKSSVLMSLSF